jgi:uncharacterized membrane protein (UPF0127 family)
MTRSRFATLALAVLMQAPLAIPAMASPQTPPPTSSDECPNVAVDTNAFLAGPTIAVRTPGGAMNLVVVNDEATRERGLMCVVRIPHARGMLFVFAPPDVDQGFWMKNTLVPLDMVFVRRNGIVTKVAVNVPATPRGTPDDRVARADGMGSYVIELGAFDAARLGIVEGTKLIFPALQAK